MIIPVAGKTNAIKVLMLVNGVVYTWNIEVARGGDSKGQLLGSGVLRIGECNR
jgi:hypothetical protein